MDSTRGLQTVQLGHADIHYHDFWLHLFSKSNSLTSGLRLAADLPAWPRREKLLQPSADDVVIVHNQNSHGIYSSLKTAQELFLRPHESATIRLHAPLHGA